LTDIRIKNFQSISEAKFAVEGFTVIVGKNNIGKSAVVRAIDAAMTNQAGKEYIKKGQKMAEVSFKRDGLDVNWKKGDSAVYKVNGETFSKLNRSVPPLILDAGFRKLEIGSQKLSPLVAQQFDPLFLLDQPGSAITEVLSSMYKLNVVSKADDLCQKELRSNKTLLKTRIADQEKVKEQLVIYDGFDSIKEEIPKLKKLEDKCKILESQIEEIGLFTEKLRITSENIKALKPVENIKIPEYAAYEVGISDLQEISEWDKKLQSSQKVVNTLSASKNADVPDFSVCESTMKVAQEVGECYDALRSQAMSVRGLKQAIECLRGADLSSPASELEESIKQCEALREYEKNLSSMFSSAKGTKANLKEAVESLEKEKEKMGKIEMCPLCERAL